MEICDAKKLVSMSLTLQYVVNTVLSTRDKCDKLHFYFILLSS